MLQCRINTRCFEHNQKTQMNLSKPREGMKRIEYRVHYWTNWFSERSIATGYDISAESIEFHPFCIIGPLVKFYSVCRPLSEFPDLDLHLVSNIRQPPYDKVLSLSLSLLKIWRVSSSYKTRWMTWFTILNLSSAIPEQTYPVDEIARRFLSSEISVF